jgi:hypothetical protein
MSKNYTWTNFYNLKRAALFFVFNIKMRDLSATKYN